MQLGGIAFHIWGKQMLRFLGAERAAFPRCHCFRFHLPEASRLLISSSFFSVCLESGTLRAV